MIDPVGESNANAREFIGLHLVDYSRRDGRAAGVVRYFQRQNDRVLRISNFNGMSSEKDVSLTQIREGDYRIPVNPVRDRKSTRLNSSHLGISYAVFCLKKKIRYIIVDDVFPMRNSCQGGRG